MFEPAVLHHPIEADPTQLSHNTQRLIALGEARTDELAAALAWDALALVPAAALVALRLHRPGERRCERRQARLPGADTVIETDTDTPPHLCIPIRAAHGRAGSIALWAAPGRTLGPADEFAAIALSWLAATAIDRLALREAQHHRRLHERRLDATFSAAPVGIAHVAIDGAFLAVNERFAAITGRTRDALLAEGFQSITHPDDLGDDLAHVRALLSGDADRYTMEKRYLLPGGDPVWVKLTVALVRDATGAPEFFVSVIEDLSDVKRAHAAATHDPLTGLLNRRGLMEALPQDLARCRDAERPLSLIYIDLDDFKQVNDRFGHRRGDACLTETGAKLAQTVGSRGSVARIGGDEFVVTMPGASAAESGVLLDRLQVALESVTIAEGWHLAASFGCATSAPETAFTADALIEVADQAMFRDKRRCAR